jgi:hypothetical protein
MIMLPVSDAAKAAIRDAITLELAPVGVVGLEFTPDRDHDGEDIVWIVVVLDDEKVKAEGGKLMSASVKAQKALGGTDDGRFAVIDYVSISDVGQVAE